MKQKPLPLPVPPGESTIATAEADRIAIERWEGEGGTPLPQEVRLRAGPTRQSAPKGAGTLTGHGHNQTR